MLNLIKSQYVRLSTISISAGERVMFTAKDKSALRDDFAMALVEIGGVLSNGRVHVSTNVYNENLKVIKLLLAKYTVSMNAEIKAKARAAKARAAADRAARLAKKSTPALVWLAVYVLVPVLAWQGFVLFEDQVFAFFEYAFVSLGVITLIVLFIVGLANGGGSSNSDFVDGFIFGKLF